MVLRAEAVGLIGMAVVLAGPLPAALARARWPSRAPRAALVLWQAVGLAGLSVLGAGCTLVAGSLASSWLPGLAALPAHWPQLGVPGWIGVALTATVGLWLAAVTATSSMRIVLARRSHRQRLDAVAEVLDSGSAYLADAYAGQGRDVRAPGLDLVGSSQPATGGQSPSLVSSVHLLGQRGDDMTAVRFVDHPVAVAYCLPGLRPRIVVSSGALTALDAEELEAVVAHERVHARGRHDLVVQPFIAWHETFPFLPTAATALGAVELLVEMLADDGARRHCAPVHLQGALQRLAVEHLSVAPRHGRRLGAQLAARTARLTVSPRPLPRSLRLLVYLSAVALVFLPPAALLVS